MEYGGLAFEHFFVTQNFLLEHAQKYVHLSVGSRAFHLTFCPRSLSVTFRLLWLCSLGFLRDC